MFRHPGAGGREGSGWVVKEMRRKEEKTLTSCSIGCVVFFFFFLPQRTPVQVLCKYNQVSISEISGIKHEFNFFFF